MNIPDTQEVILVTERLPGWGRWVIVVTPSAQRLGILDLEEIWRDPADGQRIEGVISWRPYQQLSDEAAHMNPVLDKIIRRSCS